MLAQLNSKWSHNFCKSLKLLDILPLELILKKCQQHELHSYYHRLLISNLWLLLFISIHHEECNKCRRQQIFSAVDDTSDHHHLPLLSSGLLFLPAYPAAFTVPPVPRYFYQRWAPAALFVLLYWYSHFAKGPFAIRANSALRYCALGIFFIWATSPPLLKYDT